MLVEKFLSSIHIKSHFAKLIVGSVFTALVISLGMMGILKLVGSPVNPVIPAAMGVIGAVAYAARLQS